MDGYIAAKRRIFRTRARRHRHHRRRRRALPQAHLHRADRRRNRRTSCPISAGKRPGGVYVLDGKLYDAAGERDPEVADLRRARPCPAATTGRTRRPPIAAARAAGRAAPTIAAGLRSFPACRTARSWSATHRRRRASSTTARRPTPTPPPRRWPATTAIYWIAGGMAKEGGIDALRPSSRASRHAFLIGEAAPDFAATLAGHGVPVHALRRRCDAAVAPPPTRRGARRPRRRGAAVAGLRLASTSSPISRSAATRFRALVQRLPSTGPRLRTGQSSHDRFRPHRHLAARPLVVDGRPLDAGRARCC